MGTKSNANNKLSDYPGFHLTSETKNCVLYTEQTLSFSQLVSLLAELLNCFEQIRFRLCNKISIMSSNYKHNLGDIIF